ncbi:MAG: serpin family protein [Firmicutes bacterium]|nr:serpin family protein [Bacillota bacterium]
MMRSSAKRASALILASIMIFVLAGCGKTAGPVSAETLESGESRAADFALRLISACREKGDNTLVSPLSVMAALSMTANGAEGNTLAQIEKVLGFSRDELNGFLQSYRNYLAAAQGGELRSADSVWYTDDADFAVNKEYLKVCTDSFGAESFRTRFDSSAKDAINNWVSRKTKGLIPGILDQISEDALVYLVDALAFEAEWEDVYRKDQVHSGTFTCADGTTQSADYMFSFEGKYLETENAVGFIKNYKKGDFAFAALLPKDGCTPDDVIASLDGSSLIMLLSSPEETSVHANVPKFEISFDADLAGTLAGMGITDAFDMSKADLSGIGTSRQGPVYINRVLHKTYISVFEKGTKAGAATAVEMTSGANPNSIKQVWLNRPFVFMLIDRTTDIPFFIGVVEEVI